MKLLLLAITLIILAVVKTAAQTTTVTLTTANMTTTQAPTTTSMTTVAAATTVTNRVPEERSFNDYLLKLTGSVENWQNIITNNYEGLRIACTNDLAGKFFTTSAYIYVQNMTVGSLLVNFRVFPDRDGSQIRETSFLNAAGEKDTSWLSSVMPIYTSVSGGSAFSVAESRYSNENQTSPPVLSRCSDGCIGALAGAGAVVAAVAVFVGVAWFRYTKTRDTERRAELGIAPVMPGEVLIAANMNSNKKVNNNNIHQSGSRARRQQLQEEEDFETSNDDYDENDTEEEEMFARRGGNSNINRRSAPSSRQTSPRQQQTRSASRNNRGVGGTSPAPAAPSNNSVIFSNPRSNSPGKRYQSTGGRANLSMNARDLATRRL